MTWPERRTDERVDGVADEDGRHDPGHPLEGETVVPVDRVKRELTHIGSVRTPWSPVPSC